VYDNTFDRSSSELPADAGNYKISIIIIDKIQLRVPFSHREVKVPVRTVRVHSFDPEDAARIQTRRHRVQPTGIQHGTRESIHGSHTWEKPERVRKKAPAMRWFRIIPAWLQSAFFTIAGYEPQGDHLIPSVNLGVKNEQENTRRLVWSCLDWRPYCRTVSSNR
jgi:hypothetical protein